MSLSPSVSSQKGGAHHCPSRCAQVTVVTGLEDRKASLRSQQLPVPALCQASVQCPLGASTRGARSRRLGNATFLISGAVIRAGKDWPGAFEKCVSFPLYLCMKF